MTLEERFSDYLSEMESDGWAREDAIAYVKSVWDIFAFAIDGVLSVYRKKKTDPIPAPVHDELVDDCPT